MSDPTQGDVVEEIEHLARALAKSKAMILSLCPEHGLEAVPKELAPVATIFEEAIKYRSRVIVKELTAISARERARRAKAQ